jgi:UDPglucose--hexose-1-phosphate uridylyltransferase
MADFQILQNPISKIWIVLAPRRSKRPDVARDKKFFCPFCPGEESREQEVYRVGGDTNDSNWQVRVLNNRFPFAKIHEVIVHSPDHHKGFDELPLEQVSQILSVYRQRFQRHQADGLVYIFNNHGQGGGESIPHPHTQLVVIPTELLSQIQPLVEYTDSFATKFFNIFCPVTSQWPDEVWVTPSRTGTSFGEMADEELGDLAIILSRLIALFSMRHGHEFPFNFYIYPGKNWYLRLMPRVKSLGGFEVGTGIFVNTQDPQETLRFIKSNFENKEIQDLQEEEKAEFIPGV